MPAASRIAYATYRDPALDYDPAGPAAVALRAHTVDQARPVPETLRALAVPLTLGATLTGRYDLDLDPPRQPSWIYAALDPVLNHRYVTVSFHPARQAGRGFSLAVRRAGEESSAWLGACPRCDSRWLRTTEEAWGYAVDCEECGHHDFHSIGD